MKEMSNSTLALFVIVAIVISIFGTLASLTKLNQLGTGAGLTGMISQNATVSGKANLSIPTSIWINATDNLVEIGSLNPGETNASDNKNDWWIVKNVGSVNISIDIYEHSTYAQDEIGTGPFDQATTSGCTDGAEPHTCFQIRCHNSTSSWSTCNTTWYGLPTEVDGNPLLKVLPPSEPNDTAWFGANVTIPLNTPSGTYTQQVLFHAAEST
jgi:hypothetical protein